LYTLTSLKTIREVSVVTYQKTLKFVKNVKENYLIFIEFSCLKKHNILGKLNMESLNVLHHEKNGILLLIETGRQKS